VQLKKLYRGISALETKILKEDAEDGSPEDSRVVVQGCGKEVTDEDPEVRKISLAPSVPASLHNIPTKYNIIICLWTHAFHNKTFLRTSFASVLALEHLQDFIYYAYTFYTGLLEEQTFRTFHSGCPRQPCMLPHGCGRYGYGDSSSRARRANNGHRFNCFVQHPYLRGTLVCC